MWAEPLPEAARRDSHTIKGRIMLSRCRLADGIERSDAVIIEGMAENG